MSPYKFIKRIARSKAANKGSDFSSFVSAIPLTRKRSLIEECTKLNVSIYINDPSEQSTGAYALLRGVASEAELERRLNTKKETILSTHTNIITVIALIVSVMALVKPFL